MNEWTKEFNVLIEIIIEYYIMNEWMGGWTDRWMNDLIPF